jgi:hypothetical protein
VSNDAREEVRGDVARDPYHTVYVLRVGVVSDNDRGEGYTELVGDLSSDRVGSREVYSVSSL